MRRLAVLLLFLGACDRCTCEPEAPPAAGDLVPGAEKAAEPAADGAAQLWREAAADATVGPLADPPPELRFNVSCALRYELRSRTLADVAPGRPRAGSEVYADVWLRPRADEIRLETRQAIHRLIFDDQDQVQAVDSHYPATALVTDGFAWREQRGPSTVWAAQTALPALVVLFPSLPRIHAAGNLGIWEMEIHAQEVTAAHERQRRAKALVPPVPPTTHRAEVTVGDWLEIEGEPALVLTAKWSHADMDVHPIESERAERWRGHYVVTGRGRLLHAAVIGNTYHRWVPTEGEQNEKHGDTEIELRLIQACDGVTLPSARPEPGPAPAPTATTTATATATASAPAPTPTAHEEKP